MHRFPCRLLALLMPVVLACSTAAIAQAPPNAPPAVTVAKPIVKEVVERDDFVGRFEAVDAVEIRARVSRLSPVGLASATARSSSKGDLALHHRQAALPGGARPGRSRRRPRRRPASPSRRATTSAPPRSAAPATSPSSSSSSAGTPSTRRAAIFSARRRRRGPARLNLGFTEIRAPIAGRIGRKLISEGNLVTADQTLLTTIVSLDPIYFYFDVDERSFLAYQRSLQIGGSDANGSRRQVPVVVALTDEKDFSRKGVLDFLDNRRRPGAPARCGRAPRSTNKDLFITAGPVRPHRGAGLASAPRRADARRGDRHRPGPAHRLGRRRRRHGDAARRAAGAAHRRLPRSSARASRATRPSSSTACSGCGRARR